MHTISHRVAGYLEREGILERDNERGKGDHRHDGDNETRYTFVSVEQLIQDFKTDIERLRGGHDE